MKSKISNLAAWIAGSGLLVWFDQYTKLLAKSHLENSKPFVLLDGVFELLYSENRGAAFGMLQGRQTFFFLIAIVVVAVAAYAMCCMPGWTSPHYHGLKLCVILITAGAIGNMVDRVSRGYVVDFFYFKLINFPIFNVADIYVTTATFALLVLLTFVYHEEDLEVFRFGKKEALK